jgi:ribosomal protein S18 acetylase RimI-like enzyme
MSMAYVDDNCPGLEFGKGLTEDAADVFTDAVNAVPASDTSERAYIRVLHDRVQQGELGIYTLSARCRTVGVICYRSLDGDAELVFGHLLATAGNAEGYFMRSAVDDLFSGDVHTVRSNFNWPEPHSFVRAARRIGFVMTERMSMGITPSLVSHPPVQFDLLPWKDDYAPDICRIMVNGASPADVPVYPMFSTPEGARMLMDSVLHDRHGRLLRELSFVARDNEKTIGFLLSTMLPDGSVLILNIAVIKECRKMGVGGAMLDRLIGDSYLMGYSQIMLAVTANNSDAIRLYERKGFTVNGYFRQYVLSKIH